MKMPAFLKSHATEFLTVTAIAGLIGTIAATVKATITATQKLKEAEAEAETPLTASEKVKLCATDYIPAVIAAAATGTSIAGLAITGKKTAADLTKRYSKELAAMSGSYAMLSDQFRRYMTATKRVVGEETHQHILEEMKTVPRAEVHVSADGFISTGFDLPERSAKYLFWDSISEIMFEATYEEVLNALYHLNRNFGKRGYCPLDEYYEFLGIECKSALGWSETDFEIPSLDISIVKGEKHGKKCYILYPLFEPTIDYMRDWE